MMATSQYSLKRKLILYTSFFSILMGCLLVAAAYRIALEETDEILDAQMKYLGERVAKFNPNPVKSDFDELQHYQEEDLFIDVWAYDQSEDRDIKFNFLLGRVPHAGFYNIKTENGPWHSYIIPLENVQIQISQQGFVRQNLAFELAVNMFLPYLLIMPFAIWGLSLIITRSLKPLDHFKADLTQRKPNELSPIQTTDYPIEILPSIVEINHLFERISTAQREQQQFIADAAHELRTPITALNLQTQILQSELPDHPALKKLSKGIDRVQHLVNQLLNLAKQDIALINAHDIKEFYLHELAIDCIEQLIYLAMNKEIDLGMEQQELILIQSMESSLHSVIYNLLDNAIKYTPNQGVINVSIYKESVNSLRYAVFQVEDSGPGIAPELHQHILKRFYRVHQHLEIGSGLGLSIVDQAIKRIGGQLFFSNSEQLGGLKVMIRLPINS